MPGADLAETLPATPPESAHPTGAFGLLYESLFGKRAEQWRPLALSTFFSDGWDEPWATPPRSSTGAPRQGWINAFDGVFFRLFFVSFSYVNDFQRNGNAYQGESLYFVPVSRRFQLRFDVPFIVSSRGGPENTYQNGFGDFAITPRFLLSEDKDFSQVFQLMVRTPTGSPVTGSGQTVLTPQYEFWYGGIPGGGVVRGGTGFTVPVSRDGGARTLYNYNLSFGKYWTPHEAALGDLVTYLSINGFSTLDDFGPGVSFLSLTPAIRFHMGRNYFLSAGVEVPVTGPKASNFTFSPIFWLTKSW